MSSKSFEKKGLTKKSENISEWYHDVVLRAGLADYSEVKGCMIIKPHGYAIWEKTQQVLDSWFKEYGIQNVYFPIFIPMALLEKEKKHVEGFSPELAIVTHAGGEKLAEPLAIRPTSETIMYKSFSDWIQSYRDLPLLINQWCNVVRWEKRTYPFLRTTEFLWQEGHTAHTDDQDAQKMTLTALGWYKKFYEEYFAIAPYVGIKSESEKFAGAKTTYSIEIVMPDGKALQAATSHNLGDNFAKVFEVQYLDEKGSKIFAHQTSWGLSTRAVGGLILTHGDDSGLVLPPMIAPKQVVILVIGNDESKQAELSNYAEKVAKELKTKDIRVVIDTDFKHSLGYRINEWELKGIPLRLEIGAKEKDSGKIAYTRRDNFQKGSFKDEEVLSEVSNLLGFIQQDLFKKSEKIKEDFTTEVTDYSAFKKATEDKKFIRAFWCEDADCEAKIKEETKVSTRVLELENIDKKENGKCVYCDKPSHRRWLFAQSY